MTESSTEHRVYKRPPIVEGLIDLQFDSRFGEKEFARLKELYSKHYSNIFDTRNIQIVIGPDNGVSTVSEPNGFKGNSEEGADVVVVGPTGLTSSRLAPYLGWNYLAGRARDNYELLRSDLGHQQVHRIGVRYINRIDIPLRDLPPMDENYLIRFHPTVPREVSPQPLSFGSKYEFLDPASGVRTILNCATVEAALIDHASVVLDIDVIVEGMDGIPQKPDALWGLINHLRFQKNRLFEACITDVLRRKFDE